MDQVEFKLRFGVLPKRWPWIRLCVTTSGPIPSDDFYEAVSAQLGSRKWKWEFEWGVLLPDERKGITSVDVIVADSDAAGRLIAHGLSVGSLRADFRLPDEETCDHRDNDPETNWPARAPRANRRP